MNPGASDKLYGAHAFRVIQITLLFSKLDRENLKQSEAPPPMHSGIPIAQLEIGASVTPMAVARRDPGGVEWCSYSPGPVCHDP